MNNIIKNGFFLVKKYFNKNFISILGFKIIQYLRYYQGG